MSAFDVVHNALDPSLRTAVEQTRAILAALAAARFAVIPLPEPGTLSNHHEDDDTVFYHGQEGEFVVEKTSHPWSVLDEEGNCWTPALLRDFAAAALAAAAVAEDNGRA